MQALSKERPLLLAARDDNEFGESAKPSTIAKPLRELKTTAVPELSEKTNQADVRIALGYHGAAFARQQSAGGERTE
jgi:hypothetical protein